jgi:glycosyltransferase involved in cell wall biosynthesis
MPNYNHSKYLEKRISSILKALPPESEFIIIDDASTDNSVEIIEQLAANDERIRFFRNLVNMGVCKTINSVKDEMKGKYVCFLAADDEIHPDFFSEMLALGSNFPKAGILVSDTIVNYVQKPGKTTYYKNIPYVKEAIEISPTYMQKLKKQGHFYLWGCSCLLKGELFRSYGGYLAELGYTSDWYINFKIASKHSTAYLPKFLSSFLISDENYSGKERRDQQKRKKIFETLLNILDKDEKEKILSNSGITFF